MAKTPTLRRFEKQLAGINDQLCYFLFSDAEIQPRIREMSVAQPNLFTKATFPENKYSERLYVKSAELPAFRESALHFAIGSSVLAAVEYLLAYIEDMEAFRSEVAPSEHDHLSHKQPEEQLRLKLFAWCGEGAFDGELINTIRYLRLRRNHVAHVRDEMSDGLGELVRNYAHQLNRYWAAQPTDIYDFDFSDRNHARFADTEGFVLVNLCRTCMNIIDQLVLSSVSIVQIASWEISSFLDDPRNKSVDREKQAKKFRAFLMNNYGPEISITDKEFAVVAGYT